MREKWKQWQTLFSWAPEYTADDDCSQEFKRCLRETSREWGCAVPPFPPNSRQWGRGLLGASVPWPSVLPLPPPARPGNLEFAGIGQGGEGGSRQGWREPGKHAAGRFSRSPLPPPPRRTQASLPIPFCCHSPEMLALTTRPCGGSRTGRSRGADRLGRWEAVGSCWTSLEAV